MTAVEGERAVGPPIDDEAAAPPPEQGGPHVPEARRDHDEAAAGAPAARAATPESSPDVDAAAEPSSDVDAAAEPSPEVAEPSPPPGSVVPAAPRRRRLVLGAVLLALLLSLGSGVVGACATLTFRPVPPPGPTGLLAAVDAVTPAVLRVQAGAPDTGTAGTALVVTPTGDVVTNEHLVHGESAATLIFPDGRSSTARVVAADEAADLAWLRIDGAQGLPVVRLAGPAAVRPGEDVVAMGNALNLDGPPSVTRGIVSAVGRSTPTLTDVIQTDAAISSGSSGGALVDRSGTVVGITTEALVGDPSVSVEDIAFAIPADHVATVLRGMGLVLPP